jgi:hypothetical protein
MKLRWLLPAALIAAAYAQPPQPPQKKGGGGGPNFPAVEETGYKTIFDGKSLTGWDCDPDFWRVENGVMVGETKAGHQPQQNIFCIWRGGTGGDFELKLDYKITGGNSGVQYRSVELPEVNRWVLKGYQADIDAAQQYTGQIYEERGRGFLALRGQINYVGESKRPGVIGSVGDNGELKALIKNDDWNSIQIIARGNTITQLINGHVMSMLIDDDKVSRKMDGLIGIQLHLTNTGMKIESRNIRIKEM